jgi:hypothetical protein
MGCGVRDDTSRVAASTGTAARRRATTTSRWPLEAARCSDVQPSCTMCPPNRLQLNALLSGLHGGVDMSQGVPLCQVSCSRRRAKPILRRTSGSHLVFYPGVQCHQSFDQRSVVVDDCPPQSLLSRWHPSVRFGNPTVSATGRRDSATHLILHLLCGETESGPVLQCVHHRGCLCVRGLDVSKAHRALRRVCWRQDRSFRVLGLAAH